MSKDLDYIEKYGIGNFEVLIREINSLQKYINNDDTPKFNVSNKLNSVDELDELIEYQKTLLAYVSELRERKNKYMAMLTRCVFGCETVRNNIPAI